MAKLTPRTTMRDMGDVKAAGVPIRITIGDETVQYYAYLTDAPRDYDGFGTLAVLAYDDFRVVLIREEHLQWHWQRYASGLHHLECLPESDWNHIGAQEIGEVLWKRLGHPTPEEA